MALDSVRIRKDEEEEFQQKNGDFGTSKLGGPFFRGKERNSECG
jgi:hypothetical protein